MQEQMANTPEVLLAAEEELLPEKEQISGKFRPGNIHEAKSIEFWEKELGAGEWVLHLLKHGYVLPLEAVPNVAYEEDNNASARKSMTFYA